MVEGALARTQLLGPYLVVEGEAERCCVHPHALQCAVIQIDLAVACPCDLVTGNVDPPGSP